jgi:formate dehydrogenase accessory protein FdhE
MTNWWDKQIERAEQLSPQSSGSQALTKFYARLLEAQREICETLDRSDCVPNGEFDSDFTMLAPTLPLLLNAVQKYGPPLLAAEAKQHLESNQEVLVELLKEYWTNQSDLQFFGKACLQPYLRLLAEKGVRPTGREIPITPTRCQFCGGKPQASFFQNDEMSEDSGNRFLLCGSCLTSWKFRRVVCANCGEEHPSKLGYFHSSEFDHIRVEACDSCMHYLKGIDLTVLGYAAPLVDEVYAAPLDLWARDHGYRKIELNLVGL